MLNHYAHGLAASAAVSCLLATSALAQTANRGAEVIAADKARITGEIIAEFGSRRLSNNTGIDVYTINNLKAADLMVLGGSIQRTPEKSMSYSVKFDVFNPKQPGQLAKEVAIMRGDVAIDEYGRYNPTAGNLRIDIVKGAQSTSAFKGAMRGRDVTRWWEFGEQLKNAQKNASKVYSRVVDGKTVMIEVKNPDPLGFDGLILATGPFTYLPETAVRGSLDYDYELGNWLTDNNGITLSYQLGDKQVSDRITGSIRYAEAGGDVTIDGKKVAYTGYYEYNLRFNEDAVKADFGLLRWRKLDGRPGRIFLRLRPVQAGALRQGLFPGLRRQLQNGQGRDAEPQVHGADKVGHHL